MEVSMNWKWRHQDRAHVLECLQRGEYEAIVTSRQSARDTLAHLAYEVGVLDAASTLTVTRQCGRICHGKYSPSKSDQGPYRW
jgi:hypothetical protein